MSRDLFGNERFDEPMAGDQQRFEFQYDPEQAKEIAQRRFERENAEAGQAALFDKQETNSPPPPGSAGQSRRNDSCGHLNRKDWSSDDDDENGAPCPA